MLENGEGLAVWPLSFSHREDHPRRVLRSHYLWMTSWVWMVNKSGFTQEGHR